MEPDGSLLDSQAPATCPYPESDQSIPCPIPLPEDPSKYYPPIYIWVFQVVSFPQDSPPKPFRHLPHTCYVTRPSHSSRFDHSNNIRRAVQIISSSLCSFLHLPVTSSLLGPNILFSTLLTNTLSPRLQASAAKWLRTVIFWDIT